MDQERNPAMTVTHSLVGSTYQLSFNGALLGFASKSDDGFTLEWATFAETPAVFKTMAALKEAIGKDLPDHILRPAPKHRHMSVYEACKRSGQSHNGLSHATATVKALWPHLPGHLYGDRIYRMAMEEQAKWSYGENARRWLAQNPTVGAYNVDQRIAREIELGWRDAEDDIEPGDFLPIEESLVD